MARKRIYIAASSILALSAGVAGGAALLDQRTPAATVSYETAQVSQGEVRRVVATSGTVRPRMTVQIGSELSGRIRSIAADFNARVKAGDLLAVIDPKTFESKASQARADLLSAHAALANSEAAVRKARAVLENAGKVLARQNVLGRKGISSAAAVDNAERDLNVARAEVEVAQASVANAARQSDSFVMRAQRFVVQRTGQFAREAFGIAGIHGECRVPEHFAQRATA